MRVSAKVDYAMRALTEIARSPDTHLKSERIAQAQGIPLRFLETILLDLRHQGIVQSQRGADGGYWLARPAEEITLADVIRAVEGPLANVRGIRPEALAYEGSTAPLQQVWIAVRANLRGILEGVTLADVASGDLPPAVLELTRDPGNWEPH